MRLPFGRPGAETDTTAAEALGRIEVLLQRLIAIGERTNQLLEREVASTAGSPRRPIPQDQQPSDPQAERTSDDPRPKLRRRRRKLAGASRTSVRTPLKLHEAVVAVLLDAGEPLSANEIASRIREHRLFLPPRSANELRGSQVNARVGNATYQGRFVRRDGRIWLADPEGERLRLPNP